MNTKFSLNLVLASAALLLVTWLAWNPPQSLANGNACCAKRAYCCQVQAACCRSLVPSQSVSPVAAVESANPTCCMKHAYCCLVKRPCCRTLADVESHTALLVTNDTSNPTCCMKHAYCCVVQRPCCRKTT